MSVDLSVAGTAYPFPTTNDVDWGAKMVDWATAVSANVGAPANVVPGLFNVKTGAYGALGNGTSDDTAAIQAALNDAPANSRILFPEGIYKITKPLYAGVSYSHIRGDSQRSAIIAPTFFAGPTFHLGAVETVPTAAPLVGSGGYSLYFPVPAVGGEWTGLDLRETGKVEIDGWTAFCFSGFWKPTSALDSYLVNSSGRMMRSDTNSQSMYIGRLAAGQIIARLTVAGVARTLASSVGASPINTTCHVALTYDGTTVRLFVNGVLEASTAAAGTVTQPAYDSMMIGPQFQGYLNSDYSSYGPNGYVDQIHIANVARFTAGFTPPTSRQSILAGDQLCLDNTSTYGPFVVGMNPNVWLYLPWLNNALTLTNSTHNIELSDLTISSPTTGVSAHLSNNLRIHDMRITGAAVGGINIFNNCFFSYYRDLEIVTASANRYGLAISNACGPSVVQNVKISARRMPCVLTAASSSVIAGLYVQDSIDPCIFIRGEAATGGLPVNHSIRDCFLDMENVLTAPRAIVALSDAGAVSLINTNVDAGAFAIPLIELDGITSVSMVGSTFTGTAATELVKVDTGNAGTKSVTWLASNNFTVPTVPLTLSTSLVSTVVGKDGKGIALSTQDKSATPGAATINHPSGKVSIAAGASSVVVTNSLVTATSIIVPVLQFVDATLTRLENCVPGAGSFTIRGNANATADTKVAFLVHNP